MGLSGDVPLSPHLLAFCSCDLSDVAGASLDWSFGREAPGFSSRLESRLGSSL